MIDEDLADILNGMKQNAAPDADDNEYQKYADQWQAWKEKYKGQYSILQYWYVKGRLYQDWMVFVKPTRTFIFVGDGLSEYGDASLMDYEEGIGKIRELDSLAFN